MSLRVRRWGIVGAHAFLMPSRESSESVARRLALAFRDGVFTQDDARSVGVTPKQLRTAHAHDLVERISRGYYRVTGVSVPLDRDVTLRAALSLIPDAVVSHHSAAMLHGLPEVGVAARLGRPTFTRPGDHHRNGEGFRISGSRLAEDEIVEVCGIRVTSVARTAIDIARTVKMPDALAIADAASRLMIAQATGDAFHAADDIEAANRVRDSVRDPVLVRMAQQDFRRSIARMTNWNGIGWARLAARHMNPAAESVLESVSRWHMIVFGLPLPQLGVPLRDLDGTMRWLDFWWPDRRVIGEADGVVKYDSRAALLAEKRREDALRAVVDGFVRWDWAEGVVNPHLMIRKIRHALRHLA